MAADVPVPPQRAKHTPKHLPAKKRGFFRRFWWVFVVTPVVFVLVSGGALYVAYRQIELPDTLPPIRTSYLYDRNGDLLTSLHGAVDRKIVPLSQISENLQNAVIATEDAGFYSHPGIDVKGIVTAAWTDLVKRDTVAGASTITQQLVKNVYAGQYIENADGSSEYVVPPRSIKEKIREALLAIKLEQELGKSQILARYLNTVYFGHGAYGAEAAAQTYFDIPASELSVTQSAVLAAVLHAPTLYDPIKSAYDNEFRRDYTLDQMAKYGYIPRSRADTLKASKCCGIPASQKDEQARIDSPEGTEYFIDYTRQELFDRYGSARVYGGGLQITTTLDLRLQRAAQAAVDEHLPDTRENPDAAVVTIDNRTGEVLTMVGGRDWERSKVNLATMQCEGCGRQAGSAFKPFTLAAALEQDFSLMSDYWQGPSTLSIADPECATNGEPWTPENAGDGEAGTFTLYTATEHSVNTVYAQLVTQLEDGPRDVARMAQRLGIESDLPEVCSITLGSVAVNALEMTNAYSTIASHGTLRRATPILDISKQNGASIEKRFLPPGKPVLDANIADQVTYALRSVVTGGTGYSASLPGYYVYGKTGTAQENVDAWFCGYTQELSTCVWVGFPREQTPLLNIEGVPAVYGGTIPAAIWHDYMLEAMQMYAPEGGLPYPTPEFTGTLGPSLPVSSPTPSPTATPSPSEEPSPSPSDEPSPSPSDEPTPSPTPTPTPTPTPEAQVGTSNEAPWVRDDRLGRDRLTRHGGRLARVVSRR